MKELNKKYRVIYNSDNRIIIDPYTEYRDDTATYVGEGKTGAEFDTREETREFIENNRLVYEEFANEN